MTEAEIGIRGHRRTLGRSMISNRQLYGWRMWCTCGDWEMRHNGQKAEARMYARDHLREVHGLRGEAATAVLWF